MTWTSPVFVITYPVPHGSAEDVRIAARGRTVTAMSSDGFRHEFELPPEVAVEELSWEVYADILEVRAPYRKAQDALARALRG